MEAALIKTFNLSGKGTISPDNMYLFAPQGCIKKYSTADEILIDFCRVRLQTYMRRRRHQLAVLHIDLLRLQSQARFIDIVVKGKIELRSRVTSELVQQLMDM